VRHRARATAALAPDGGDRHDREHEERQPPIATLCQRKGTEIWGAVTRATTAYGAVEGYLMATAREFSRSDQPRGCLIVLSALHASEENEAVARFYVTVQQGMLIQARDGADRKTLETIARLALAAWPELTAGKH
jgi:hypothetical protein